MNCFNRYKEPQKRLYTQNVLLKGKGLFCRNTLKENEFITEYTGEILHKDSKYLKAR